MKKKCSLCGIRTEDWEIRGGGKPNCWDCGRMLRRAEKQLTNGKILDTKENG